jgi:stage V sporulation protein B
MAESYTKKMVLSFGIIFICLVLANILGYVLRLVLARALTPAEYGLLYAVMALFGFISFAQTLGLSDALVRTLPDLKSGAQRKRALLSVVYTQLAGTVIIFLLTALSASWLAEHYFHNPIAQPLLVIYAISILLSPLEPTLISFFQGMGRTAWYGYLTLLRAAALLLFTLLFLWLGLGSIGAALAYVLVYLTLPFIYLPLIFKLLPEFGSAKAAFDMPLLRTMFKFGVPIILVTAAGTFLTYIDTIFLTFFRSLEEVALYNVALPTAGLLWFFSSVIYSVAFPISSEISASKANAVLKEGVGRMYLYVLILVLPLAAILLLFPDIILNALFGGEYIGAALALQILVVAGIIYSVVSINNAILAGLGDSRAVLRATVTGAIVNVVLNLLLIPPFGIEGSAAATMIAFLAMLFITLHNVRKHVAFTIDFRRITFLLMATCLLGVLLYFLRTILVMPLLMKVFVGVMCAAIVYIILLFLLRILTFDELRILKKQVLH